MTGDLVTGDLVTPYVVILVGFVGLFAAMLAVDLLGRVGRKPFRPLGRVLEVAMAWRTGRWIVCGAWLFIGFHFLAR